MSPTSRFSSRPTRPASSTAPTSGSMAESQRWRASHGRRGTGGSPMTQALVTKDVAKAFGATRALRSANFTLEAGEIHAIVGENGSGKPTLVKILAGVHRPDAGELQVDGRTVDSLRSPAASLEAGIATVFQEVLVVEARSV